MAFFRREERYIVKRLRIKGERKDGAGNLPGMQEYRNHLAQGVRGSKSWLKLEAATVCTVKHA